MSSTMTMTVESGAALGTCNACGHKTGWYRSRRDGCNKVCLHDDPKTGKQCRNSAKPLVMVTPGGYQDCCSVGNSVNRLVREFIGRKELNGQWDENFSTYWGTRQAVDQVRAFMDGYFARCVETNPNMKR